MPAMIDVSGRRFGKLLVIADGPRKSGRRTVVCKCDCGKEIITDPRSLANGHTKSCGCYQRERVSEVCAARTTHGDSGSIEHVAWQHMKRRCCNPTNKKYPDYGGRGITVCERWMDSFQAFLGDMGRRPSSCTSIDRIDVNGNYEPENCRWASSKEQSRNKRNHRIVEYKGTMMPLSAACELSGTNYRSALYRLNSGKNWQPLPLPPPPAQEGK